jgi:hypothetical protein
MCGADYILAQQLTTHYSLYILLARLVEAAVGEDMHEGGNGSDAQQQCRTQLHGGRGRGGEARERRGEYKSKPV